MKIGVIPDLHSKQVWKKFIKDNPHIEKWVMLGDYCDDYPPTSDKQIYDNLVEIIEFKKTNPDKVILLWGNHEAHYLHDDFGCSGFRASMKASLQNLLKDNQKLFQYAYQIKNYLFTHAGLTTHYIEYLKKHGVELTGPNYADQINQIAQTHNFKLLHVIGRSRGGWDEWGGVLWEDKSAFWGGRILPEDLHQIVGHSKVEGIANGYNVFATTKSIRFCDCLDTQTEFYELEI